MMFNKLSWKLKIPNSSFFKPDAIWQKLLRNSHGRNQTLCTYKASNTRGSKTSWNCISILILYLDLWLLDIFSKKKEMNHWKNVVKSVVNRKEFKYDWELGNLRYFDMKSINLKIWHFSTKNLCKKCKVVIIMHYNFVNEGSFWNTWSNFIMDWAPLV